MPARTRIAVASIVLACALAVSASAQDVDAGTDGGMEARDACGAAAFAAAETDGAAFDTLTIQVPTGLPATEALRRISGETQTLSRRAQTVAAGYDRVLACGSPRWTMAALERQAEIYERLEHVVRTAGPLPLPPQGQARFAEAIEPQLRPIRCLWIVRRVLVVRASRAGLPLVDRRIAQTALDALILVPHPEFTRCIYDQQSRDPSFSPFSLSDLAPFPLGAWGR